VATAATVHQLERREGKRKERGYSWCLLISIILSTGLSLRVAGQFVLQIVKATSQNHSVYTSSLRRGTKQNGGQ
jgi:hypothetical protein